MRDKIRLDVVSHERLQQVALDAAGRTTPATITTNFPVALSIGDELRVVAYDISEDETIIYVEKIGSREGSRQP